MERLWLKTWFLWFKPCSSFKCVILMEYVHSVVFFSFLKVSKHLIGFLVQWYSTCMMKKHLVTIHSTYPNVYWKQWEAQGVWCTQKSKVATKNHNFPSPGLRREEAVRTIASDQVPFRLVMGRHLTQTRWFGQADVSSYSEIFPEEKHLKLGKGLIKH